MLLSHRSHPTTIFFNTQPPPATATPAATPSSPASVVSPHSSSPSPHRRPGASPSINPHHHSAAPHYQPISPISQFPVPPPRLPNPPASPSPLFLPHPAPSPKSSHSIFFNPSLPAQTTAISVPTPTVQPPHHSATQHKLSASFSTHLNSIPHFLLNPCPYPVPPSTYHALHLYRPQPFFLNHQSIHQFPSTISPSSQLSPSHSHRFASNTVPFPLLFPHLQSRSSLRPATSTTSPQLFN